VFFLIFIIIRSFYYWQKKLPFNNQTDKLSLTLFIFTHTQLLVGLILYFISPFVQLNHFSAAMKNKVTRFWTVEHVSLMLIAIILISVARISLRKISQSEDKHKRLFFLNTLALILILGAIPWPFREAISEGRHYLFGFFLRINIPADLVSSRQILFLRHVYTEHSQSRKLAIQHI